MLPPWSRIARQTILVSFSRTVRPVPSRFAFSILPNLESLQYITPAESQTVIL